MGRWELWEEPSEKDAILSWISSRRRASCPLFREDSQVAAKFTRTQLIGTASGGFREQFPIAIRINRLQRRVPGLRRIPWKSRETFQGSLAGSSQSVESFRASERTYDVAICASANRGNAWVLDDISSNKERNAYLHLAFNQQSKSKNAFDAET